jgi:hypothetical protein
VTHDLCEYQRAISLFEEAMSMQRELSDQLGISILCKVLPGIERPELVHPG